VKIGILKVVRSDSGAAIECEAGYASRIVRRRAPSTSLLAPQIKRALRAVLHTMVSAVFAGCVALRSTSAPEVVAALEPRLGNYYFLPRGLIQLDGTPSTGDFQVTVKTFNVPDRGRRFFLRQHHNAFYEDDLVLKVNGKGLLETVNLSTEDKTPAILDKVADTFIDVAKISASGGISPLFRKAEDIKQAIVLRPFHVVFDPFDPGQRNAAVAKLRDCGFELVFHDPGEARARVASESKDSRSLTQRYSHADTISDSLAANGILFHPPTAIELGIATLDNTTAGLLQHVFVRLPSPNEVAVMDASRAFLIKKKNNYTLVDGDLIQIDHNRPSQALALVGVPASIVHKVADAIPTIISIEDKRASRVPPELAAQKAQLDAQTAVLNSQMALIEARRKAQGDGQTNTALTREALINKAEAENQEALARGERAKAEQAEAAARVRKPTAPVTPTPSP
jgi:hypothetical protein